MKFIQLFLFSFVFASFSLTAAAQQKNESFKVSGECGMCQKKIESAAKSAGASFASWDADTKQLQVKYDGKKTNQSKIMQAIAAVGYDTPEFRATDETYNKLHGCCKYERESAGAAKAAHSCCDDQKCNTAQCHKDGKCTKDMSCCKEAGCDKKDCCKQEKAVAASFAASHSCCDDKKCNMSECHKDGKCTKDMNCCKEAGCDKKDCCKKG